MSEQQTFTEEEVKEAGKWFTFIHKNAKWGDNISTEQAQEIGRLCNWMHKHVKTMQDHIFEIKQVTPAPPEDKKKKVKDNG